MIKHKLWCRSGITLLESDCDCVQVVQELGQIVEFKENKLEKFLHGEEFYNLMQTYRHVSLQNQVDAVRAFEAVKAAILEHV